MKISEDEKVPEGMYRITRSYMAQGNIKPQSKRLGTLLLKMQK